MESKSNEKTSASLLWSNTFLDLMLELIGLRLYANMVEGMKEDLKGLYPLVGKELFPQWMKLSKLLNELRVLGYEMERRTIKRVMIGVKETAGVIEFLGLLSNLRAELDGISQVCTGSPSLFKKWASIDEQLQLLEAKGNYLSREAFRRNQEKQNRYLKNKRLRPKDDGNPNEEN
jgi:hypothetical protein